LVSSSIAEGVSENLFIVQISQFRITAIPKDIWGVVSSSIPTSVSKKSHIIGDSHPPRKGVLRLVHSSIAEGVSENSFIVKSSHLRNTNIPKDDFRVVGSSIAAGVSKKSFIIWDSHLP